MKTKDNNYNVVLKALRKNFPRKTATAIGFRFRANAIEHSIRLRPIAFLNDDSEGRSAYDVLMTAFAWDDAPEGAKYWIDIIDSIKK